MPVRIEERAGGVVISVKVVPGSSRDRIVGELGEELKIAVSKPPQGGAANQAVVALLADWLDVPHRQVRIVRGASQPHKRVEISGITAADLRLSLGKL